MSKTDIKKKNVYKTNGKQIYAVGNLNGLTVEIVAGNASVFICSDLFNQ